MKFDTLHYAAASSRRPDPYKETQYPKFRSCLRGGHSWNRRPHPYKVVQNLKFRGRSRRGGTTGAGGPTPQENGIIHYISQLLGGYYWYNPEGTREALLKQEALPYRMI